MSRSQWRKAARRLHTLRRSWARLTTLVASCAVLTCLPLWAQRVSAPPGNSPQPVAPPASVPADAAQAQGNTASTLPTAAAKTAAPTSDSKPASPATTDAKPTDPEAIPGQVLTPAAPLDTSFSPADASHDIDVGNFYFRRGDYPGALARYQDAMVRDPRATEAYYRAGDSELKLKDRADATKYWQQYLQRDPSGKWASEVKKELKKYPPPDPAANAGGEREP